MGLRFLQRLFGAVGAATFIALASPALALETDAEGWIGFDGSKGQIALDGMINGEKVRVVLDSTVNSSVISSALAERAGIREDRKVEFRMGGSRSAETVYGSRRFELEIDGSRLSFGGLPIVPDGDFDMIIGHQAFEGAVVQIDYPNERFRLLPREAVQFEGNVPARRGPFGELMVEANVRDTKAWLILDTGLAGATVLTRNFVSDHGLEKKRVDADDSTARDTQVSNRHHLLQLDEVAFGPYRFERFVARYGDGLDQSMDVGYHSTGTRIQQGRRNHDGLLGFDILKNFLVTADYHSGKLHLQVP